MTTKDEPAFPVTLQTRTDGEDGPVVCEHDFYYGLTKRELFAAMAMQGILANTTTAARVRDIAKDSVKMADALLAALEKEQGDE